MPKIIIILGPTASGKTDLGLALAKKFNGEIVSADSRQIYKQMDIGTAKPDKKYGIPHHLMDITDPGEDFSLADFKAGAVKAINDIVSRKKLPIVVGGTGLYIQALVDNLDIPKIAPSARLRKELSRKSPAELAALLQKIG